MKIFKKTVAAIIAATTVLSMTSIMPNTVFAEDNVNVDIGSSAITDVILSRNMIALESEAEKANVKCYGDYINPNDLETADGIKLFFTGASETYDINVEQFFAKDTELCDRLPSLLFDGYDTVDMSLEICNYNGTGNNLYYDVDVKTGVIYQTFNTGCGKSETIETDYSALANDSGDKEVRSASLDKVVGLIPGFAWVLNPSNGIYMPYDDVCGEKENKSEIISVMSYGVNDDTLTVVNVYTLFGIKWINTYRSINASNKVGDINIHGLDAFQSELGNIYQNIVTNPWIKTNGQKGDTIKITSMVDMRTGNMLMKPENEIKATDYNPDNEHFYKTLTYTLKEDNERLPLKYGNYIIYNESTGIYETSTSCVYINDHDIYDNRLLESVKNIDHTNDAEVNFYGVLGFYDAFNGFNIGENAIKTAPVYDVPKTLNISDTETIPLISISGENVTKDHVISPDTAAYFFAESTDAFAIGEAAKKYYNTTSDISTIIPYNEVRIYDVPVNKSEILTYFTTSNAYTEGYFNTYAKTEYAKYDGENSVAKSIDKYINELGSTMTKHTVYGKDIQNDFPDYNGVKGDMNQDGTINVADVVMCQKYMLGCYNDSDEVTIANYAACNLYPDDRFDVFDLVMLKRMLLEKN